MQSPRTIDEQDNTNRINAGRSEREWALIRDYYNHVVSEACDDSELARAIQGVFGNALCGDRLAAKKAVDYIEGRTNLI